MNNKEIVLTPLHQAYKNFESDDGAIFFALAKDPNTSKSAQDNTALWVEITQVNYGLEYDKINYASDACEALLKNKFELNFTSSDVDNKGKYYEKSSFFIFRRLVYILRQEYYTETLSKQDFAQYVRYIIMQSVEYAPQFIQLLVNQRMFNAFIEDLVKDKERAKKFWNYDIGRAALIDSKQLSKSSRNSRVPSLVVLSLAELLEQNVPQDDLRKLSQISIKFTKDQIKLYQARPKNYRVFDALLHAACSAFMQYDIFPEDCQKLLDAILKVEITNKTFAQNEILWRLAVYIDYNIDTLIAKGFTVTAQDLANTKGEQFYTNATLLTLHLFKIACYRGEGQYGTSLNQTQKALIDSLVQNNIITENQIFKYNNKYFTIEHLLIYMNSSRIKDFVESVSLENSVQVIPKQDADYMYDIHFWKQAIQNRKLYFAACALYDYIFGNDINNEKATSLLTSKLSDNCSMHYAFLKAAFDYNNEKILSAITKNTEHAKNLIAELKEKNFFTTSELYNGKSEPRSQHSCAVALKLIYNASKLHNDGFSFLKSILNEFSIHFAKDKEINEVLWTKIFEDCSFDVFALLKKHSFELPTKKLTFKENTIQDAAHRALHTLSESKAKKMKEVMQKEGYLSTSTLNTYRRIAFGCIVGALALCTYNIKEIMGYLNPAFNSQPMFEQYLFQAAVGMFCGVLTYCFYPTPYEEKHNIMVEKFDNIIRSMYTMYYKYFDSAEVGDAAGIT